MMGVELSRRLGVALGAHDVDPADRAVVVAAGEAVEVWEQLPAGVRELVARIEAMPLAAGADLGPP